MLGMVNRHALTALRIIASLSKSELAAAAGWSLSYYSEVESGTKTGVGMPKLRSLAAALDERLAIGEQRIIAALRAGAAELEEAA